MSTPNLIWHPVCAGNDIAEEDLMSFNYGGKTYVVYHTPSGFYATDGICTHETANLADGFVNGDVIECPRHQGRFHIPSGKAKSAPACVDLRTYPVKNEGGQLFIGLLT